MDTPMAVIEEGLAWLEEGEGADAVLEEAMAAMQKSSGSMKGAWKLVAAEAYLGKGKASEGLSSASEALAIFKESGLKAAEVQAACSVASANLAKQDWEDAIAAVTRALDLTVEVGDYKGQATMFVKLAKAYLMQMKDPYMAARSALSAVQVFDELGDKKGSAQALLVAGEAHLLYDPEAALKVAKDGVTVCDEIGDIKMKAEMAKIVAAAKAHIATMQSADIATSFAARGDSHISYKWPKVAQQVGEAAPDPFMVTDYVAPEKKDSKAKGKGPNFTKRSFKWTMGRHQTDGAWFRQELQFMPPKQ